MSLTAEERNLLDASIAKSEMVYEELYRVETLINGDEKLGVKGLRQDVEDIKEFMDEIRKVVTGIRFLFKFLAWVGGGVLAISALVHDWFDIFK